MVERRVRVWDLPTRVFHWALVLLVGMAWLSGEVLDNFAIHEVVGLSLAGLLAFRLVWGLVGSTYARFSQFVRGPQAVSAYLNGRWQGLGHNPLGGWSVVAMLAVLLGMVLTGVFANNDGDYAGPLAFLVSSGVSGVLTSIHKALFNLLVLLVLVHVGAIAFYKMVLGKDLVRPMLNGMTQTDESGEDARGGGVLALLLAVALAALVVWGLSGGWHEPVAVVTPAGMDW